MKNLKIGVRISIGFAIVTLLLIATTVIGIGRLSLLSSEMSDIVQKQYPKTVHANNILDNLNLIARSLRNTIIFADAKLVAKELERVEEARKGISESLEKLKGSITSEKGKALLADVASKREVFIVSQNKFIELTRQGMLDASKEMLIDPLRGQQLAYMQAVEKLIEYQNEIMERSYKEAVVAYENAKLLMIILGLIATAFSAVTAWLITRSITGPIAEAVLVADTVANGDLTRNVRATSNDEVGQLLKSLGRMTQNLVKIVSDVRVASDTIATASSQIAAGNQDLSSRTEQQASSLEETASSMEELTSTVKQNADNARQANQLAHTASEVAASGGQVVSQVVSTMQSINQASSKIADIISVIDGIAFQTNILALNAAVEAARAGEQGRGFAVVATEVRNLAQRSAAAAKEIKELIDDSVEKVASGTKLVDTAGTTMNEVVGSVRRVTDVMAEIQAASQEQSAGIEQVNQAIGQMDQVTQQNAALVEEAAAAAESLQDQAAKLTQVVSVFKLDGMQAVAKPTAAALGPKSALPSSKGMSASRSTASRGSAGNALAPQRKVAVPAPTGGGDWEEF